MHSFVINRRGKLLKKLVKRILVQTIYRLGKTPAAWWLSKHFGLHEVQCYQLDYRPFSGQRSASAERLVDFCLGEFQDRPIVPCSNDFYYFQKYEWLRLETDPDGRMMSVRLPRGRQDQKEVPAALVSQRTRIPGKLRCWLVQGDSAGRFIRPEQGLHLSGMRPANHRQIVLVPTSNRERFLGPNLHRQMQDLRKSWIPWEDKTDTAWWGGALTGDRWATCEPRTLTRREVLCHYRDHPSPQVFLYPTELQEGERLPDGLSLSSQFSKKSAFGHKCLLLLPGNDIASGSSWYFAGNSVVLMPRPHLEHILYFEMNPWEHYVPLENDPADILIKLQWVLDNPLEARKIVDNAHERLRWLCGPEYLWACNEVLRRVSSGLGSPA